MLDPVFYNDFKYVYQDIDTRMVNNNAPPPAAEKPFDVQAIKKTDRAEKPKKDTEKDKKDPKKSKKKDNMFGL